MSNILFIVEGAKDEPKYIEQFIQYHKEVMEKNGNHVSPIIVQSYGTLIYDLYRKISSYKMDDEFETIPVLLELLNSKSISYDAELDDYEKFSDIFLFFDLDAHYYCRRKDRNEILCESMNDLLSFFNESTEKGKLLISYPMFEALKCFNDDFINESNVTLHSFNIYEVEKKGSSTTFKQKYKCISSDCYNNPDYSNEKIEKLVQYFIYGSMHLVENEANITNSESIFINQFEKFIKPNEQVVILSSFPHFIVDIFGIEKYVDDMKRKVYLKDIPEHP
jgi:hypothetical protein